MHLVQDSSSLLPRRVIADVSMRGLRTSSKMCSSSRSPLRCSGPLRRLPCFFGGGAHQVSGEHLQCVGLERVGVPDERFHAVWAGGHASPGLVHLCGGVPGSAVRFGIRTERFGSHKAMVADIALSAYYADEFISVFFSEVKPCPDSPRLDRAPIPHPVGGPAGGHPMKTPIPEGRHGQNHREPPEHLQHETAAPPPSRVNRGRTEMSSRMTGILVAVMAAITLASVAGTGLAQAQTNALTDRAVLVALYQATDGENWAMSTNWLSDRPLGEWYGIVTNDSGRVTEIGLPQNLLAGELPSEVSDLTELTRLDLRRNELIGEITDDLDDLINLDSLSLANNLLSGEIPAELGNLPNLESLSLENNHLDGDIPTETGQPVLPWSRCPSGITSSAASYPLR